MTAHGGESARAPAIPAATLIVFRESGDGPPDLLMVERARAMAFAGGAMVFPGGRVDPGDHALAATIGGGADDAARIAAIRETIEEAGLPIGLDPVPDAATVAALRTALADGMPFATALAAAGTGIAPATLVPWARWCPDFADLARRFDTMFYIARLPAGAPQATVDATENVRLVWASARALLDAADSGRIDLIFPTRRNLERLALFDGFAAAAAHALTVPVRAIVPRVIRRDGLNHLTIPEDAGYPVTAEPLARAVRG